MNSNPILTIELPLPPQEIRPNTRVHWARKAKKVREYRSRSKWAAIHALSEREETAFANSDCSFPIRKPTVRITMLNKTARKMDQDNLIASMKSAMDGLTDAGVWDDDREVTILSPIRGKDSSNPRIIIEIWE